MGVGPENNAGPSAHVDSQGNHEGYHWFLGGACTSGAHLGPSNNGVTGTAATNAILSAAQTSEAAMVSAMPGWLADWYDGLSSTQQAAFYGQVAGHPGVK